MEFPNTKVDVVVSGGGPAGLLIAYGLQRMGISTCVIEKLEKSKMPMYGRACLLYPRSLELLDSYELLHEMAQVGYTIRNSVTYKDGERVTSHTWTSMFSCMGGTFLDYCLGLRLKYSEEIFQAAYENIGGHVAAGWTVANLLTDLTDKEGYKVTVEATQISSGKKQSFQSKFIVGADGGKSAVRQLAGIKMEGIDTPYRWVRVDGIVETDMPDIDVGSAMMDSATHGSVLFLRIDHGRTRIGFVLNAALIEKYGESLTEDEAVKEAQKSVLPFTCSFKTVDWYTCYTVRQALAETFMKDECIFLVGDAAHIHSSAGAQGMNTGIHDVTNLAWKLAGVIKGVFRPSVLDTYNLERRESAQTVLAIDRKISAATSGQVPGEYQTSSGKPIIEPKDLMIQTINESMQFNIGLGISYKENILNRESKASMLAAGTRAPDKLLYAPGTHIPVRLQTICRNFGQFCILIFAGEPLLTRPRLRFVRTYLDSPSSILNKYPASAFKFLTLIVGERYDGQVALGCKRFGEIWYDRDSGCHAACGITPANGAIVVLRPDGIVGFATTLLDGQDLNTYFGEFMLE